MLSGSKHIAVAALQRVGIEERRATCCLESYAGYVLRNLGDVRDAARAWACRAGGGVPRASVSE